MASAHLLQVGKAKTGFEQLSAIQQFRDWDLAQLVRDAEKVYKQTSWGQPSQSKSAMGLLTALFV